MHKHFDSCLKLAQQRVEPGGDWRERLRDATKSAMQRSSRPWPDAPGPATGNDGTDDDIDAIPPRPSAQAV